MIIIIIMLDDVQALFVHDLDHRTNSLSGNFGLGHSSHRAIAEEERTFIVPRKLCSFLDGERPHSNGDIDARRAVHRQRDRHVRERESEWEGCGSMRALLTILAPSRRTVAS